MIPYIFSMKNRDKIRVYLENPKDALENIHHALDKVTENTHRCTMDFIYTNGVVSINLLDVSAIYPETNEVK